MRLGRTSLLTPPVVWSETSSSQQTQHCLQALGRLALHLGWVWEGRVGRTHASTLSTNLPVNPPDGSC